MLKGITPPLHHHSLLNALGSIHSRYGHAGHLLVEPDPGPAVDTGLAVQVGHAGGAGLEQGREGVQQCLDLHRLMEGGRCCVLKLFLIVLW